MVQQVNEGAGHGVGQERIGRHSRREEETAESPPPLCCLCSEVCSEGEWEMETLQQWGLRGARDEWMATEKEASESEEEQIRGQRKDHSSPPLRSLTRGDVEQQSP